MSPACRTRLAEAVRARWHGRGAKRRSTGRRMAFAADRPGAAERDEHRDTTQDPGGRRRFRRRGVRPSSGAAALPRRSRRHPGDAVLLPALPAPAAARRRRGAHAPVDRALPAPQQPLPDPHHSGRRHRGGPRGEGLRGAHHHRPDRQRALRLHRAGARQHHPHLRHPGAHRQRVRHEDPGGGRVHPRPRHLPAGPRRRQPGPRGAGLPAAVRGGGRRLRGHRDRGVPAAADARGRQALQPAGPGADQVAPDRHRAEADAGAGREARPRRTADPDPARHRHLPGRVHRQGRARGGDLHGRPGGAHPHADLDGGRGGEPADGDAGRGDGQGAARGHRRDVPAEPRRGVRAGRLRGRARPRQGPGGCRLPAHRPARTAAGAARRREPHRPAGTSPRPGGRGAARGCARSGASRAPGPRSRSRTPGGGGRVRRPTGSRRA